MTKDNINKHIGQVIHTYRKLNGLTLANLAMQLGISYQQLQKYEKGANKISADKLFLLAELLNANPVEFFPGQCDIAKIEDENEQKLAFTIANLHDKKLKISLMKFLERVNELSLQTQKLNFQN